MDDGLRAEAAEQLQAAIDSVKLKLQNKEVELATVHNPDDNEATRKQIADQKEILADMEQRLVDLKKGPVDVDAALGAATGGLFGAPQRPGVDVEEAKKNATDLTGLVRKKRKAEEPAEEAAEKKPRVDEAAPSEEAKADEPAQTEAA
jgi:HAT1-interacting factor 1